MSYHYRKKPKPGTRAGETRELGAVLYDARTLSDWPPVRPSGPEPGSDDARGVFGDILTLSASEKKLAMIGGALALGYVLWKKRKRRR